MTYRQSQRLKFVFTIVVNRFLNVNVVEIKNFLHEIFIFYSIKSSSILPVMLARPNPTLSFVVKNYEKLDDD